MLQVSPVRTYEFGDILNYLGGDVTRNILARWIDAGIIAPVSGGGSAGKRRQFSFRTLVQVAVCGELYWLGVNEPALRSIVTNLTRFWDGVLPKDVEPPVYLWIGHMRYAEPPDETTRHTPIMRFVDAAGLLAVMQGGNDQTLIGECGIAIPLTRIITELEQATGDHFDLAVTIERRVREKLKELERV